jgi:uncharacterized membrane protein YccC
MASASTLTPPAPWTRRVWPANGARQTWLPVWSKPAALRALRAAVIVPALFALCSQVIGNLQMATFAAFGGFATLVLANFAGTRRHKAVAHLGLAVVGSVLLVIGTAVNGSTALAAVVTVLVTLPVLFGGVLGPNAALGGNAALLAYVLPAASAGTVEMIPSRLAGWWMASAAGTLAVLLISPKQPGDQLRTAAADTAEALAAALDEALGGSSDPAALDRAWEAKLRLMGTFTATPYRPTGLATRDQALANVVEMLEWSTILTKDALGEAADLSEASRHDLELLHAAAAVLKDVGRLLRGQPADPDLEDLERLRAASAAALRSRPTDLQAAHVAFHARTIAVAARTAAADALIATGMATPETIAALRLKWVGQVKVAEGGSASLAGRTGRLGGLGVASTVASRHASLRSVWFINSVRGAVALAAAVAVADLTSVQHGFWVVLGTLSVLRSNASTTGATALRALGGTVAGFAIGALLIDAIGTNDTVLWIVLPLAVLVAAYTPGTAPFAVGQAAFTVVVAVLYNLLVPVGWKVGVVRIEDVALGCAVSVAVGVLLWPRGASAVVGNDLADAFRQGARYLRESVTWSLGGSHQRPEAGPAAVRAATRLDDALRGFLAEQGAKRVPKEDLWRLVGGAMRLRLTASSLEGMDPPDAATGGTATGGAAALLDRQAGDLASWYQLLAGHVARAQPPVLGPLDAADATPLPIPPNQERVCTFWIEEHLRHLRSHHADLLPPADKVAAVRQRPWWR